MALRIRLVFLFEMKNDVKKKIPASKRGNDKEPQLGNDMGSKPGNDRNNLRGLLVNQKCLRIRQFV